MNMTSVELTGLEAGVTYRVHLAGFVGSKTGPYSPTVLIAVANDDGKFFLSYFSPICIKGCTIMFATAAIIDKLFQNVYK